MESAITAGFAAAAGAAVPDELDFILQDSGTSLIDIDLRQRPAKVQEVLAQPPQP